MIDVFYYSICGKKTNEQIDILIQQFVDSPYIPAAEKKILHHVQSVASNGNYPTSDYFKTFYLPTELKYNSIAEIKTYCSNAMEFYKKQFLDKKLLSAINETESSDELLSRLSSIVDTTPSVDVDEDSLEPILYGDSKNKEFQQGILTGVKELDEVTYSLQPGNVASICAFTGHGKSTFVDSIIFKNALEGKKCILVSLELSPNIVWSQLEARYMYQIKGIQVNSQDLLFHKMPSDVEEKVIAAEQDFKEFSSNLLILDESYLDKPTLLNYKLLTNLLRTLATKLGGLDLIAFDHVGQFELMFPDCGNRIIKSIQSFTKTFIFNNKRPTTILAVQANRQGEQRARKRNGVYDIQAISELNEVEKTSSYIIFMYTSDDMKIMQETKITLQKHRLGPPITEPIVTTFNPSVVTVGAAIEDVSMSDDDFNTMGLDLGDGFDDF